MTDTAYHETRFTADPARADVWKRVIAALLRTGAIQPVRAALELGAGYCEFINHVPAGERYAIDISPLVGTYAAAGVRPFVQPCQDPFPLADGSVDLIFASNLFEHLTHAEIDRTLAEARRVLTAEGRLVLMQPNYRFCAREYFDDYTHVTVFSHVSLADYVVSRGFICLRVVPRFLPFSMKSRLPTWGWLVSLYLRLPVRPFAKQMLLVFGRP